jgi:2-haloacid dehalogenase
MNPGRPVVFDAYGTLFDPMSLAAPLEARFPGRGSELAATWRATQLRHTWLRSLMGPTAWADFDTITRDALTQTLEGAGLPRDTGLADQVLALYRTLPPYADVADGLAALPPDRPSTILTNGRAATVEATVRAAGLGDLIRLVLSTEAVRTYKPAPAVYALATSAFGVQPADVAFVSGNPWDCAGAGAFGFRVIHVRRNTEPEERVGPTPVTTIDTLRDLAAAIA